MGSFLIVELQPSRQSGAALVRGGVRHRVGPLSDQGLDEALSFAVGLGAIGPGALGRDPKPTASLAKRTRAIGPTVVGQHPLDANALALERAHGAQPEAGRGVALLVGQD